MTTPKDSMEGWEERFDKSFIYTPGGYWSIEYNGSLYRDKEMEPYMIKDFIRSEISNALKSERQRVVEMVRSMENPMLSPGRRSTYKIAKDDVIARLEADKE